MLDVTSTADALLVEAALPGIRPEDVEITVEDGNLTIRAESNEEREETRGEAEEQPDAHRDGTPGVRPRR